MSEGKKHCKWYHEEFCTNDQSPCVADYCPVVEYPELCKFREENVVNDLVNDLVNEEYKLRGKTYFEVAEIIKKLKTAYEMTNSYPNKFIAIPNVIRAEKLTKLGYRKIPEGAVVLTREEYKNQFYGFSASEVDGKVEKVRKKTAEKYHAEIEKAIDSVPNATKEFVEALKAKNDEIVKELVDEDAKESE